MTREQELEALRDALAAYYRADVSSTGCDCWQGGCSSCDAFLLARAKALPLLSGVSALPPVELPGFDANGSPVA